MARVTCTKINVVFVHAENAAGHLSPHAKHGGKALPPRSAIEKRNETKRNKTMETTSTTTNTNTNTNENTNTIKPKQGQQKRMGK